MLQLRTAAFFTGWIGITLVMGLLGLPLLLSQKLVWRLNDGWAGTTLWWLRVTCHIRSEKHGEAASQLIACKHQSAWDTLMLWHQFKNPVFVLKRELYWIPIFGWYLWRSGQIAINRRHARGAYEHIRQRAPQLLAQGRTLIIFPEGTRVRIGDKKPYHAGIARISELLQLAVTPAALNAGLFWPKASLLKRPGMAVLQFLPPLPPCGSERANWMGQLEQTIETESQLLAALTPGTE